MFSFLRSWGRGKGDNAKNRTEAKKTAACYFSLGYLFEVLYDEARAAEQRGKFDKSRSERAEEYGRNVAHLKAVGALAGLPAELISEIRKLEIYMTRENPSEARSGVDSCMAKTCKYGQAMSDVYKQMFDAGSGCCVVQLSCDRWAGSSGGNLLDVLPAELREASKKLLGDRKFIPMAQGGFSHGSMIALLLESEECRDVLPAGAEAAIQKMTGLTLKLSIGEGTQVEVDEVGAMCGDLVLMFIKAAKG